MSDPTLLTKEELENFIGQASLDVGDIVATSKGATLIRIADRQNSQNVLLYVHEARALRDWLNKVLP